MSKTKLAKLVNDAAHRETLRQIEYKARWYNRNIVFAVGVSTCAVVRDSEFLEQMRRRHSAFRIIADPTLKLRVGESIAKCLHALPYRIVNVCSATADSLVKLGRDVSRLCLHKIRIM